MPTAEAPPRTQRAEEPQHMQALQRANRARLFRAGLKQDIKHGRASVLTVIRRELSPTENYLTYNMKVIDVITAAQRWGKKRAKRKVMNPSFLSEQKTVGELTDRQRTVLLDILEENGFT